MEPTTLLPVISLLSLVGVKYGGWHFWASSPDVASSGSLESNSLGQATPMPECCWCSRSSTSSTSTVAGTQRGFSGLRDCSYWLGSWLSRKASSSISPAGRRIEARWERWSREPAPSSSRRR